MRQQFTRLRLVLSVGATTEPNLAPQSVEKIGLGHLANKLDSFPFPFRVSSHCTRDRAHIPS